MTIYGTPPPPQPPTPPPGRRGLSGGRLALLIAGVLTVLLAGGAVLVVTLTGKPSNRADADPPAPAPAGSASRTPSPAASKPAGTTFTLSAVGDTIVAAAPNVPANGGKGFFNDVKASLTADLQMANLEEPITNDTGATKCGAHSSGCHAFRAPPVYVQALKEAGFTLVNLANNHALDFGQAGHDQTEQILTKAGIKYTGPPGLIATTTVKGVKVAVIGFAPYQWANSLTDIPGAAALVKQAKAQNDVVIVQAHVGAEGAGQTHVKPGTEIFLGENRGDSIKFGHAVVDAGADLVIMHGPHVMRAMEFYKDHLIAYSMGNFAGYHALIANGVLGISGVLHVTMDSTGHFIAGSLVATSMVSPGVPRMDPKNRAWAQVRSLCRSDFPKTGARIGTDGTITRPAA
jgi:hypothetical protein